MCAIASNYIDLGYFTLDKTIEYFISVKATPWGTEDSSALLMNVLYNVWSKWDPVLFNIGVKALVAPFYAVDIFNFVVVVQTHEKFPDDDIQARTESSTSDDANLSVLRVAQDVSSGPCFDELYWLGNIPVTFILGEWGYKTFVT